MKNKRKNNRVSALRTYQLSDDKSDILQTRLADIDFYPRMSEETLAFNAVLQIHYDGQVFAFDCCNDGHGGSTDIRPKVVETDPSCLDRFREILKKWAGHLSTQRDDAFYETASRLGWNISGLTDIVSKSVEGEVDNMLAVWCDANNL